MLFNIKILSIELCCNNVNFLTLTPIEVEVDLIFFSHSALQLCVYSMLCELEQIKEEKVCAIVSVKQSSL